LFVELAAGGMATVYLGRATDGRDGAPLVAIKRPHKHLATDKAYMSMMLDEARLASAIQHPNVVRVRELGFELGEPFIVMDYVEGASLAELRKELAAAERAIDARVAAKIALDALAGLHAAHTLRDDGGRLLGIIHRDVSPHNVLIGCDGVARLTDFGIAKAEDRVQVTRTHEVKGKLAYLAPERIDKRRLCSVQSDVFSFAVVLWEAIAGRRLFRGEEAVDTLQEVLNAPIPRLRRLGARIPPTLDDVIARGLSRDLETRYQTAQEFAEAIERAVGKQNVGTTQEVSRVIETVFGARLRLRHDKIRAAMKEGDARLALAASGLAMRPPPTAEMLASRPDVLASIAPPAPSARYTFGNPAADYGVRMLRHKPPWRMIAAVSGGIIVGAALVFAVFSRKQSRTPISPVAAVSAPAPPTTRHVDVPLPFVATFVSFDEAARELTPASDMTAFDVPESSPPRHRLSAVALDGTRAEGYVREQNGVAKVEEDGFTLEAPASQNANTPPEFEVVQQPPPPSAPSRPSKTQRGPRPTPTQTQPVGTVRNGFTKLK
jgi:serine/threonine-protein kinase